MAKHRRKRCGAGRRAVLHAPDRALELTRDARRPSWRGECDTMAGLQQHGLELVWDVLMHEGTVLEVRHVLCQALALLAPACSREFLDQRRSRIARDEIDDGISVRAERVKTHWQVHEIVATSKSLRIQVGN